MTEGTETVGRDTDGSDPADVEIPDMIADTAAVTVVASVAVAAVTVLTSDTAAPGSDAAVDAFAAAVFPRLDCRTDPLDDSSGCVATEPSAFETSESKLSAELIEPVGADWAGAVVAKALLVVDPITAATDVTAVSIPVEETLGAEPADGRLVTEFSRPDGSATLIPDEEEVAAELVLASGPVEVAAAATTLLPTLPVAPRRSVRVERGSVELVVAAAGVELVDALNVVARVAVAVVAAPVIETVAVDPRRSGRLETGSAEPTDGAAPAEDPVDALDVAAGVAVAAALPVDPRRSVRLETDSAEPTDGAAPAEDPVDALDVAAGVAVAAALPVDPRRSVRLETGSAKPTDGAAPAEDPVDALDVAAGVAVAAVAVDPRRSVRLDGLGEADRGGGPSRGPGRCARRGGRGRSGGGDGANGCGSGSGRRPRKISDGGDGVGRADQGGDSRRGAGRRARRGSRSRGGAGDGDAAR